MKNVFIILLLSPIAVLSQEGHIIHTHLRVDSATKKIDSIHCAFLFGYEDNAVILRYEDGSGKQEMLNYDSVVHKGKLTFFKGKFGQVSVNFNPSGKRKTSAVFFRSKGRKTEYY
jgi:hypothetical protein